MAVLNGAIVYGLVAGTYDNYHITPALNQYNSYYYPYFGSDLNKNVLQAAFTRTTYIAPTTFSLPGGGKNKTYFDDFYNRIHLSVYKISLGNILSTQTYALAIWNAWLTTKTMTSISQLNLDNTSITLPITAPYTFKPLENVAGTVAVAASGSPTIDGKFLFNFAGESPSLVLVGDRVILWPFCPLTTFTETREWKTEVMQARSAETRYSLREYPRISLNYKYLFKTQQEFSYAKGLAKTYANVKLATPVWSDIKLVSGLTVGTTTFKLDTSNMELQVGAMLLFWENYKTFELKEILSFTSTTVTLKLALEASHTNCYVTTVQVGYLQNGVELARNDDKTITGSLNFNIAGVYSNPIWSPETFLTLPIYTAGNVITGGLQEKFIRTMEIFDSEVGDFIPFESEDYTRNQQTLNIKAHNLTAIYNLRRFLDYLKGKYTAFWMPSYNADLVAYQQIFANNAILKVNYGNWATYGLSAIRVIGSSTVNFQVTAVSNNNDGTESLTLSPVPTADITNITSIQILTKVRLNADSIAIEHEPKLTASVKTQLIEVKS